MQEEQEASAFQGPYGDETEEQQITREINEKKQFLKNAFIDNYVNSNYGFDGSYEPKYIRQNLSGGQTVNVNGVETHIHGGFDRMTGLVSMVEDANESGNHIPLVVMRDEDNEPIRLYTQEGIRPILDAVRQRKNIVESAHNLVMQGYHRILKKIDNTSATLGARNAAADEGLEFLRNYASNLETAIERYDPVALPSGIPERKEVYRERLESHALGHAKTLRGVLTQQGIDLAPSCTDEADALRKVAVETVKGHILIEGAATNAESDAAYSAAVAAISEVHALNTPTWNIGGTDYPAFPSSPVEISGNSLVIEARHPVSLDPANNADLVKVMLQLRSTVKRGSDAGVALAQTSVTTTTPKAARTQYTFHSGTVQTGDVIEFRFRARNLCGYSDIQINLTVT